MTLTATNRWKKLDDTSRQVVSLTVLAGCTIRETAAILNLPPGRVAAVKHRAMAKLMAGAALRGVLRDLEQQSGGDSLQTTLRHVFHEEAAARSYVSERYRMLIDRKYLDGLSPAELEELAGLNATLDEMEEPYYEAIIKRLRQLVERKGF